MKALARYQIILLGEQRHIGVNNLNKVVARQCSGQVSNPRSAHRESSALTTAPPSRWQVTLCDPIWQVTLRSSEMEFYEELYTLNFYTLYKQLRVTVQLSQMWNENVWKRLHGIKPTFPSVKKALKTHLFQLAHDT